MNIYHPTYSEALSEMKTNVIERGFYIDDDVWFNVIACGSKRPRDGETTRLKVPLHKDDKPTRKYVEVQVYNRGTDKNPFELNMYIC